MGNGSLKVELVGAERSFLVFKKAAGQLISRLLIHIPPTHRSLWVAMSGQE